MLAGFGVDRFGLPGPGGKDDGEDPVGCLDTPGSVDAASHSQRGRVYSQPGLFLQFAGGGGGDGLAFVRLSRGKVPMERGRTSTWARTAAGVPIRRPRRGR